MQKPNSLYSPFWPHRWQYLRSVGTFYRYTNGKITVYEVYAKDILEADSLCRNSGHTPERLTTSMPYQWDMNGSVFTDFFSLNEWVFRNLYFPLIRSYIAVYHGWLELSVKNHLFT